MNHRNKNNHLGRKYGHRKSILSNMASSLIKEKRVFTTLAKAKALKKYIEPIITKSKIDTVHSRRNVFSYLRDKKAVSELFKSIFDKVRIRPGGYTRIIKIGFKLGDQSIMSFMELVDFNEIYTSKKVIKSVRRSRRKTDKKMNDVVEEKQTKKINDVVEEKQTKKMNDVVEEKQTKKINDVVEEKQTKKMNDE
ncbi:50S ribosomal protein L17 [Blattabacterium cuenoti]|uniref:50S ribosomal protein L17 n=1 Tax=Blattabacterium cuenoti TaxID=1653831 RepID=UPI00163C499E|nr:50S ribosomal protein L17 [Blattabacterium cuenoti]